MKLTNKDKDFLDRLKLLLIDKALSIELKDDGIKRLVLRQNYGDKIEKAFNMSRQGGSLEISAPVQPNLCQRLSHRLLDRVQLWDRVTREGLGNRKGEG